MCTMLQIFYKTSAVETLKFQAFSDTNCISQPRAVAQKVEEGGQEKEENAL